MGISLRHEKRGRTFTRMRVQAEIEDQHYNLVDMPPVTDDARDFYTWLQHPIEVREISLIFDAALVAGDKGSVSPSVL